MMSTLATRALGLAALPLALDAPQHANAGDSQAYPTKPIRVLVPQAPGGSNDIMARYFAGQIGERIGRQIVVDNRPGADGVIATDMVAKSTPDGYNLLMASAAFTMNPSIRKLP